MKFCDLACEHLSQYRVEVLGVKEDGIYHHQGRKTPKAHILPFSIRDKNILEQYRDQFFSSDHADIKFHQYFHHLNSSQALCVNLFYPLVAENALNLFGEYLGLSVASDLSSLFEKESDIEIAARKTSFDFFVQQRETKKIFVEVKYTENGFAQAKNNEEHQTKFAATYLPLLKEKKSFLMPECEDCDFFLRYYQILRNFVHISENDHVVLLFPAANTVVAKEAIYARDHFLTDEGRAKLRIVYLEEFVPFLESRCSDTDLEGYYKAFREKYLP